VGKLAPEALEAIATHLDQCTSCLAVLELLSRKEDALLDELREAAAREPFSAAAQPGEQRPADREADTTDSTQPPTSAAGTTLVTPAEAADGPAATSRYQPLRLRAPGGLGEVYEAWDTELDRPVALKRIKDSHADNPDRRRRIRREAEITGWLEHPGVVPVYGLVQDEGGQPCYAMRLIEGESLQEALNRFHAADRPGRDPGERGLALRQLLDRFRAVCATLAYAHSRGVIHRDLKPANIMLGPFGETLVVDWGLANELVTAEGTSPGEEGTPAPPAGDAGEDTRPGQAMGTPAFMSPEQAAGDWDRVGPASDIYALGATLYAVLAGRAPFAGDVKVVLAKVQRGDFPPPRQMKRNVPAALEAVCLRAMAPRPEDRYPTARELAAEVERWLAGEPVTAYREPFTLRAGRWVKRHRALVTGLAGALVAVLVLGGVVWRLAERDREERRAQTRREVEELLAEANRLWGQTRKAAPAEELTLWREGLTKARQAQKALNHGEGSEELRRQVGGLLDKLVAGEKRARAAATESKKDADMVKRVEEARLELLKVKAGAFDREGAARAFATAFRAYGIDVGKLAPAEAAKRLRQRAIKEQLVVALDSWAALVAHSPRRLRRLALAAAVDPNDWRNSVRDAVRKQNTAALVERATAGNVMAQPAATLEMLGQYLKEAKRFGEAAALLRQAQQKYPGDFWINHQLAILYSKTTPPRPAEAVRFFTAALALRSESPTVHYNLGVALAHTGDLDGAVKAFRKAIQLREDNPRAYHNLGVALAQKGDLDGAVIAFRKAIRVQTKAKDQAEAYYRLGAALYQMQDLNRAFAAFEKAFLIRKNYSEGHYHYAYAKFFENLGISLDWGERCKRLVALDKGRYAYGGGSGPAKVAKSVEIIHLYTIKQFYLSVAQYSQRVFRANPNVSTDLRAGLRYNAACAAALAASGKGQDATHLDDDERARWRKQALAWLSADLALWTEVLLDRGKGGGLRRTMRFWRSDLDSTLRHWQTDLDLAAVRDGAALAKLPKEERESWNELWKGVDTLLKRAQAGNQH
jgi:Flp pilus assembly protein TadD/tRNA A-37 threonylcarbamoyl transferase component Bud32